MSGAVSPVPALGPAPEGAVPAAPEGRGREEAHGGWSELLHNRRFLLLTTTGSLAGAGYAVYAVSVLFLAYELSGSLLLAGVVLFVEYGVYTATFLIAPLVDRAEDKRTVLLICYPIQIAAAVALAFALAHGRIAVPVLLGLVFVLALAWDFVWATFLIAPPLVVAKRHLFLADSLTNVVSVATQFGGYAGGAVLLFLVGPAGGAAAYAVLLVGALLAALPLRLVVAEPPRTDFWATFRAGWNEFRGTAGRALRAFAVGEGWLGFFTAIPPLLITAIAFTEFRDPSAVYGPLIAGSAVGGAVAGVVVGHFNPRRRVGLVLVLCPVAAGVVLLALLPGATPLAAAVAIFGTIGAALTVRYSAKYTWVQGTYPAVAVGRMSANLYLFTGIPQTVAVLTIGFLSRVVSLAGLELLDAAGLLAGGFYFLAVPSLRRLAF
jgi:hypothetical protein